MKQFLFFISLIFGITSLANGQCNADYTYEDANTTFTFTSTSTSGAGDPIVSYFWDFGDGGNTSTEQNPTYTFSEDDEFQVCLTITTQNGCTDQSCMLVEVCTLTITAEVSDNCDGDNNVSITFTIMDIYDQARDIFIYLDGNLVNGSPFEIRDDEPVTLTLTVPGDGLEHTIFVQAQDIEHCNLEYIFTTIGCASGCFLTGMDVSLDAGGAVHTINVDGDFFSPANTTLTIGDIARFQWVDGGHSTTSDATSGPDSWNSGVIGNGSIYDVVLTNPGVHPFYCIPHGGPNGNGMSGQLIANCPPGGMFDVSIIFNTSIAGASGYNLLIDGVVQSGSPFQYSGVGQNSLAIQFAGDGLSHEITIQDVGTPGCTISRTFIAPDCGAAPTCNLTPTATITGGCNGANEVPVQVEVNSINGGASGFNILVDGNITAGPISYDNSGITTVDISITGDGNSHTITVQDIEDNLCSGNTTITTTNCAQVCALSNLTLSNGNPFTHIVEVQDFQFSPENISITSGDVIQFVWTGDVAHTATSDATNGADSFDSGLLNNGAVFTTQVLSEGVHPYYCIPHGAPGGVGMSGNITIAADCDNGNVSVQVNFTAEGIGFNGYEILVDGNISTNSPFTYAANGMNSASVFVPGDGQSHTILIRDIDDNNCSVTGNITTPDCNASTCQLNVSATENGPCAGTNVPVQISVTDVGGGVNGFTVSVDGNTEGTFSYNASGTTLVDISVIGDGQSHTIVITDVDDLACTSGTSITITDCSISCSLSGLSLSTGSSTTHNVDVQDFQFSPENISITSGDVIQFVWTGNVAHTATSDATNGADSFDSGLLNNGAVFTTQVLSEGVHPYYCIPHGAPGGVGMSGNITVAADCDNGNVSVQVNFTSEGAGFNGYEILVDGNVTANSPFTYVANEMNSAAVLVPGDGQLHAVLVRDIDDNNCSVTGNITTPDCNASTCQLSVSATLNGSCDNLNNVPIEIVTQELGGGPGGFNILLDGNIVDGSPYSYDISGTTSTIIPIPGDGQLHFIRVEDVADATCSATNSIQTPDCSQSCQLTNLNVTFSEPSLHIIDVEDFQFAPSSINVVTGDTIRFVWTGQVAHTATSDASSGIDSWDSGLLGNGAIYDVVIQAPGVHPYYCIPHGAPGGVGMAGTINATDDCENGQVQAAIQFNALGGSINGFNILIDGITDPNGPFPYLAGINQMVNILIQGDGNIHQIVISDVDDNNCSISNSIVTPNCNEIPCFLEITASSSICINDSSMVTFTIISTGSGASGFNLLIDGIVQNNTPIAYAINDTTIIEVMLEGNGNSHSVFIFDIDEVSCNATASFNLPDCSQDCFIHDLSITFSEPGLHEVNVEDFKFSPEDIIVAVGDTIRFIWTGVIPHTTTSDAMDGPDSWDSGLLGEGAVYDVIIQSPGVHPYYCIPHGAPGGIGMAGTITALPNCENQMQSGQICFKHDGIGMNGFNVMIDGSAVPESPFQYSNATETCITLLLPSDGGNHQLVIQDVDLQDCQLDTTIFIEDCENNCFGFDANFNYFISESGIIANFQNTSSIEADSFIWNFGDGTISNEINPVHQFPSTGNYLVCLQALSNGGCIDSICKEVDFSDPCLIIEAEFEYSIAGNTVQFTDVSSGNTESWLWGFGDGSTSDEQSPSHTYNAPGLFTVCLLVFDITNNCSSFKCIEVNVLSTSIKNDGVQSLIIYPNPASSNQSQITIGGIPSNELNELIEVRLYDSKGATVSIDRKFDSAGELIYLEMNSRMAAGSYFVRIITDEKVYSGKLLIYQ